MPRPYYSEPDYDELYTLICILPRHSQIVVRLDGSLATHEPSVHVVWRQGQGLKPIALLRATGEFDRSRWGIGRDPKNQRFTVQGLDGSWEDENEAFKAAVNRFGTPAEVLDTLRVQVLAQADSAE